jgi:hypothetical protein
LEILRTRLKTANLFSLLSHDALSYPLPTAKQQKMPDVGCLISSSYAFVKLAEEYSPAYAWFQYKSYSCGNAPSSSLWLPLVTVLCSVFHSEGISGDGSSSP